MGWFHRKNHGEGLRVQSNVSHNASIVRCQKVRCEKCVDTFRISDAVFAHLWKDISHPKLFTHSSSETVRQSIVRSMKSKGLILRVELQSK